MEAYYSSDEEIAWGPLTLREIRKHFSEPTKVSHRQSDFAQTTFLTPSTTMSAKTTATDAENKTDESASTYTASSTLAAAQSSKNNSVLEKLANVIDSEDDSDGNGVTNEVIVISSDESAPESVSWCGFDSGDDNISEMHVDTASDLSNDNIENCDPSSNEPDNTVDNIESNDPEICNDTLEEMEMASLKQGLDYEMPGDDYPISGTTKIFIHQIEDPPKPLRNQKLKKSRDNKYDYIRSPVGNYIKNMVPPAFFKPPSKPVKSEVAPRSPLVNVNKFKNIVSPIGVYINSPMVCLKRNIPAKKVPALTGDVMKGEKKDFSIPQVIYKPAKTVVTTSTSKDIELPSIIKKLVKQPMITIHESRIKANVNQSAVARQLLKEDISVDCSLSDQPEDVSFVNIKQVFPSTK